MNFVRFERLSKNAKEPVKSNSGSCGFNLFAACDNDVPTYGSALILTDISLKMPKGVYGRIASRSGIALVYGISVLAGVIDPDYIGGIGVLLFNHGEKDFHIKQGDRCALIIFEKYLVDAVMIEDKNLDESNRGYGGLGSTGISDIVDCAQTEPLNLIVDNIAVCDCHLTNLD